jgi:hypothetical protein
MSRTFRDHLVANNTAGLEVRWRRAPLEERRHLIASIHDGPVESEAQAMLRVLVDPSLRLDEQVQRVDRGLEALADLASTASADRHERLARWAREPDVREALLVTAAQRGRLASEALVDWLASADDDALTDALIPIFLAAVERREGARLARLAEWARVRPALAGVGARADVLRATSRAEWEAFLSAIGLAGAAPFTALCSFRASAPAITLEIDPRRLNWFTLTWGEASLDAASVRTEGLPASLPSEPALLPGAIRAELEARGLRVRPSVRSSGDDVVQARLEAWCGAT